MAKADQERSKIAVKALVSWPSAFMEGLVKRALASLEDFHFEFDESPESILQWIESSDATNDADGQRFLLQWSAYDRTLHELTQGVRSGALTTPPLSSVYTIRKALIRKHFLHNTILNWVSKKPSSCLTRAVPKTWKLDLAFADELDELWADELWDLSNVLEGNEEGGVAANPSWFILKPGMSDRGMGIRLFRTKDDLYNIFQSFEDPDSGSDSEDKDAASGGEGRHPAGSDGEEDSTGIATSQLRHFVIQEYLSTPLLLDPSEARLTGREGNDTAHPPGLGKKFHLRVYAVASGGLSVYFSPNVLALFAGAPYHPPTLSDNQDGTAAAAAMDLSAHLTNTCLQRDNPDTEGSVRLLTELVGCPIYSGPEEWRGAGAEMRRVTQADVDGILDQVSDVLAETFNAALAAPIHFQTLPNAFELFGVDFIVTHGISDGTSFVVSILELNAEPAIEMTGPRLGWILDDLFRGMAQVCVGDYFRDSGRYGRSSDQRPSKEANARCGLQRCLHTEVRSSGAW